MVFLCAVGRLAKYKEIQPFWSGKPNNKFNKLEFVGNYGTVLDNKVFLHTRSSHDSVRHEIP